MIYLVLNVEEDPFVLYVCKDEETAKRLVSEVKENFVIARNYSSKDEVQFIKYIALDTESKIMWAAYDDSKDSL